MRVLIARYANDIVSLTVLTLLSIALIAAQAGATPPLANSAKVDTSAAAEHVIVIDHDISLRRTGE